MPEWFWIGLTMILLTMLAALWRRVRRVSRWQRRPDAPLSTVYDPPHPRPAKCHIITYRYEDGETRVVHSICGSDGQRHDDAYGQALRPDVTLVQTIGGVHTVEII